MAVKRLTSMALFASVLLGAALAQPLGKSVISNVDPGKYYVRVTPHTGEWFMGTSGGHRTMLASQFYGGVKESKDATPIHVGGGESLAGLDFHLSSEPAVEVRGQVAGVPRTSEAQPSETAISSDAMFQGEAGPEITIGPAESGLQGWSNTTMTQAPDYRFQVPDVAAGRYRVEVSFHSGGKEYAASQVVDLQPDSGKILLNLAPAADIQGTFRVEGQAAAEDATPSKRTAPALSVKLSRPGSARGAVSATVGADGHFTLKDVAPGDWQLAVTPVPPGFLKSAQLGDKDVRFTTFEVGSRPSPLNVVVSMHTSVVEGEIDAGSSDSKRAGIVSAPIGEFHNLARYYYGVAADENGKFKVRAIAPGKYKIFALEKLAAAGFRDPEAVDQLDDLGEPIELAEGATVQAHPKLISTARALKALP